MEPTLPSNHPDLKRIELAAHKDIAPKSASAQAYSLGNALAMALGKAPGNKDDLENIEFLTHVLSVNRASGSIDDETFERLLLCMETMQGRAELVSRFTQELETEHGYEEER